MFFYIVLNTFILPNLLLLRKPPEFFENRLFALVYLFCSMFWIFLSYVPKCDAILQRSVFVHVIKSSPEGPGMVDD